MTIQILGSYWTLAGAADPMGEQRCLHDLRRRVEIAAKAGMPRETAARLLVALAGRRAAARGDSPPAGPRPAS